MENSVFGLKCVSRIKCLNMLSRPSIQHFGDLFQSSYKNNCRFFAGVLLIVWIAVVFAWNSSSSREEGYVIMTALSLVVLTLHTLIRPHRRGWINVVDTFMYVHLTAINILAVYIYSAASMHFSQETWTIIYLLALFAPATYPVLYLTNILRTKWKRSCRKQPPSTAIMPLEAVVNDAYVYIEHTVEVDPTMEETEMETFLWESSQ